MHKVGITAQGAGSTYLFDIENDPTESVNLAKRHPEIVAELRRDLEPYRANKPKQGKYWMVLSVKELIATFIPGDCSMNPAIKPEDCVFKHPYSAWRNMSEAVYVDAVRENTKVYIERGLVQSVQRPVSTVFRAGSQPYHSSRVVSQFNTI